MKTETGIVFRVLKELLHQSLDPLAKADTVACPVYPPTGQRGHGPTPDGVAVGLILMEW